MSTSNPNRILFSGWNDFGEYGIYAEVGNRFVRLSFDLEGSALLRDYYKNWTGDAAQYPLWDEWKEFAAYVLQHVEGMKFIGVTKDGEIVGCQSPEEIERYVEADWRAAS